MTTHDTPPDELRERPIGDLVKQLAGQTSTLVRQARMRSLCRTPKRCSSSITSRPRSANSMSGDSSR